MFINVQHSIPMEVHINRVKGYYNPMDTKEDEFKWALLGNYEYCRKACLWQI